MFDWEYEEESSEVQFTQWIDAIRRRLSDVDYSTDCLMPQENLIELLNAAYERQPLPPEQLDQLMLSAIHHDEFPTLSTEGYTRLVGPSNTPLGDRLKLLSPELSSHQVTDVVARWLRLSELDRILPLAMDYTAVDVAMMSNCINFEDSHLWPDHPNLSYVLHTCADASKFPFTRNQLHSIANLIEAIQKDGLWGIHHAPYIPRNEDEDGAITGPENLFMSDDETVYFSPLNIPLALRPVSTVVELGHDALHLVTHNHGSFDLEYLYRHRPEDILNNADAIMEVLNIHVNDGFKATPMNRIFSAAMSNGYASKESLLTILPPDQVVTGTFFLSPKGSKAERANSWHAINTFDDAYFINMIQTLSQNDTSKFQHINGRENHYLMSQLDIIDNEIGPFLDRVAQARRNEQIEHDPNATPDRVDARIRFVAQLLRETDLHASWNAIRDTWYSSSNTSLPFRCILSAIDEAEYFLNKSALDELLIKNDKGQTLLDDIVIINEMANDMAYSQYQQDTAISQYERKHLLSMNVRVEKMLIKATERFEREAGLDMSKLIDDKTFENTL